MTPTPIALPFRVWPLAIVAALLASSARQADAQPATGHRLHWDESHPRFLPGEYAITASAITAAAAIEFGTSQPLKPKWVGPILFDQYIRDALVAPRLKDRKIIQFISDALLVVSALHPIVIDAGLIPAIDRNPDMFQQLTMMDLEAYGISYLLMRATHRIFARERPAGIGCATDKGWAYDCGSFGVNASFFSGHSSMSAVGAGVTCAHHAYVPLYGGGAPDALACVGMTGLALTVATSRIIADRHWASDAIMGFILGYGTGLAVPLIHYTQHLPGKQTTTTSGPTAGPPELADEHPPAMFSWGGQF